MDYKIENLTKEEAIYIGKKINDIVPREVDADEEEFVLKVENENGEIIGGCVAEAYEYHWSRVLLEDLWVDELRSEFPLLTFARLSYCAGFFSIPRQSQAC